MKLLVLGFSACALLSAFQDVKTQRAYDMQGRPLHGTQTVESAAGSLASQSQRTRNMNGRQVPIQDTEERVISDSGGVRIVDRVVRKYDPNGNPGPAEKVRLETRKESDGSVRTISTTMRGDINGRMQVAERSTEVVRKSGGSSETTVVLERPTMNTGFEIVERRQESAHEVAPGKTSITAVVQQADLNGRLSDIARRTVQRTETPSGAVENTAEYETAATGQMRLARQIVSTTTSTPAGSSRTEVDVFEHTAAGKAGEAGVRPMLTQRKIVETMVTPNGTMEQVSAAFPTASDPGRLGPMTKLEETACTGSCGKKKAP